MDRGVTIVTGGASGIGLAIAKALLGEGWKLIVADLAQGPLDAARAELEPLRANAVKCVIMDVANEASVIAALDGCEAGFGPVRGLVNSAGIGRDVPFFDTSVELFRMAAAPSSIWRRCRASAAISAGRPMAPPRAASLL
jgi:NAD(P)-dependent dehydrogenase (short-subunit alcohol dehydrogenase family)